MQHAVISAAGVWVVADCLNHAHLDNHARLAFRYHVAVFLHFLADRLATAVAGHRCLSVQLAGTRATSKLTLATINVSLWNFSSKLVVLSWDTAYFWKYPKQKQAEPFQLFRYNSAYHATSWQLVIDRQTHRVLANTVPYLGSSVVVQVKTLHVNWFNWVKRQNWSLYRKLFIHTVQLIASYQPAVVGRQALTRHGSVTTRSCALMLW